MPPGMGGPGGAGAGNPMAGMGMGMGDDYGDEMAGADPGAGAG